MAHFSALTYFLLPWLLLGCAAQDVDESFQSISDSFEELRDAINHKDSVLASLSRHVMLNRFLDEERIRAEGGSGIVDVRNYFQGSANYYTSTHSGHGFAAIHDHSHYPDALGMGEVTAVLNGVQFRTRHNDYLLKRPSSTSNNWHETEPITPPPVPQSVSSKGSVQEEMAEMTEYFRAFQEQNATHRDYQQYFKPVMCYLEGAWMADATNIEEAFDSVRTSYNAYSWEDMTETVRLEGYLGRSTRFHNTAQMPTTIMGLDEGTNEPVFAQWNYRILCFPVEEDIPTSYFKLVDDTSYRFPHQISYDELMIKRGARFVLDEDAENGYDTAFTLLDRITSKIPGKDNTPGTLTEGNLGVWDSFGVDSGSQLNLGYYNRMYKTDRSDGMNYDTHYRGFSDPSLFVALTTQPKVAPLLVTQCTRSTTCQQRSDIRASWMIPLEVVYLTPLLTWNPYNVVYREGDDASAVYADNRRGYAEDNALNGTKYDSFFHTPFEFFSSGFPEDRDKSDTVPYFRWVLDDKDVPRQMTASGTRVVLPNIEGVGHVRLRYPIAPVHGEGSAVWKELSAFKDYLASQLQALSTSVN